MLINGALVIAGNPTGFGCGSTCFGHSSLNNFLVSMPDSSPNFDKNIFTIVDQPYDLRRRSKVIQPLINTETFGLKTFRYEGARIWNKLPEKNATDVNVFKTYVNHWSGLTCQCWNCIICNMCLVWETARHHALFPNVLIHCFSFMSERSYTDFYP